MQDLLNFTFVSETMDDIKTVLQPFVIAYASADYRQANIKIARVYGVLQAEEQSMLLSYLEALQAKEVISMPLNYLN